MDYESDEDTDSESLAYMFERGSRPRTLESRLNGGVVGLDTQHQDLLLGHVVGHLLSLFLPEYLLHYWSTHQDIALQALLPDRIGDHLPELTIILLCLHPIVAYRRMKSDGRLLDHPQDLLLRILVKGALLLWLGHRADAIHLDATHLDVIRLDIVRLEIILRDNIPLDIILLDNILLDNIFLGNTRLGNICLGNIRPGDIRPGDIQLGIQIHEGHNDHY
ncbi:hypothetical protein F5Y13DRAFT_200148 [Hypoxylon sp. FL1857]|nr:hypothetical protein F5Y13DRAFT_200148 [Hypoxylon sp. FL1857]